MFSVEWRMWSVSMLILFKNVAGMSAKLLGMAHQCWTLSVFFFYLFVLWFFFLCLNKTSSASTYLYDLFAVLPHFCLQYSFSPHTTNITTKEGSSGFVCCPLHAQNEISDKKIVHSLSSNQSTTKLQIPVQISNFISFCKTNKYM